MRKLIVAEQISLDGVIQSPGGPTEDPSADFHLGGWVVPYAGDVTARPCRTCSRSRSICCWGVVPTIYSRRIGRAYAPSPPATPSLTCSTACPSTWPRIDSIRLIGRTVMRWRETLPTRYACLSTGTASTY